MPPPLDSHPANHHLNTYITPLHTVVLMPAERDAYMRVHNEAARVWASVRTMSHTAINQKLLQIMSLLQPLRRYVCGLGFCGGDG